MTTDTTDRQLVWLALTIVAMLVVLPAFVMVAAMMETGPMMGGTWGGGMWGVNGVSGWMLGGVIVQLLSLAFVVVTAVLAYRAVTRRDGATDPALEELRVAYARGEVSDEEYERRRKRLETES